MGGSPERTASASAVELDRRIEGLNGEVEAVEEVEIILGVATERGEIVAGDDGVDAAEQAFLRADVTEGELAAAGEAEDGARQCQAEGTDGAQGILDGDEREVLERGAGAGVKEVHGDLGGVELGELGRELGPLFEGLAEAEDAADARLHAGIPDHFDGVDALLPRVRGDHVGEVAACGFEVVVVAVDAGLFQAVDLGLVEDAEGGGHVDVHLGPNAAHRIFDLLHEGLVGAADGGDDAELGGAGLLDFLGGLDETLDIEADGLDGGIVEGGLGAEAAVLGAAAGFQADDALDVDLFAAPLDADFVGEGEEVVDAVVGKLEDLEEFILVEWGAFVQDLLVGAFENVSHGYTSH